MVSIVRILQHETSYGVPCCCFSSCGRYLLSCSTDGSTIAWGSQTGEVAAVLQHPARSPLRVCPVALDTFQLLAGACDGTVALCDLRSRTLRSAVSDASLVACCLSPCGQMFVTGCTHRDLKLWDTDINLLQAEKDAHDLGVTCCSFAPKFKVADGCCGEFRLASCGQDSQLKIWIVSQREVQVTAVALSPTMPWIATGSMDRTVKHLNQDSVPRKEVSRSLQAADWSKEDVQTWLCEEGLQELVSIFKANDIDGAELSQLNKETAAELGIGRLLRKIKALKAEQSGSDALDEFLCPITRELMKDPVIAADGYPYEQESM